MALRVQPTQEAVAFRTTDNIMPNLLHLGDEMLPNCKTNSTKMLNPLGLWTDEVKLLQRQRSLRNFRTIHA